MATDSKGLFATLFDLEFKSFITIRFVKVIYVILMAVILLTAVFYFIAMLVIGASQDGGGFLIVAALIFVPLVTLVYLLFVRILMETVVVFFRIGENTTALVAAAGLPATTGDMTSVPAPPTSQGPSGYGYGGAAPPPPPDSPQKQS